MQVSDPSDHLNKWNWAPVIELGNNESISYEVDGTANKGFYRLQYSDQTDTDLDNADFDGDGLTNLEEITPYTRPGARAARSIIGGPATANSVQTNPLDPDTDHDGLGDKWERDNGLDPTDNGTVDPNNGATGDPDGEGLTNAEEQELGTDPHNQDTDGDGVSDGDEVTHQTDPNDPEDTAAPEWFVLTGDSAEDVVKTETRTFTIKKGDSRVLVIGTTSAEYPQYTEESSQFDDTLFWEIYLPEGNPLSETVSVNNRHTAWDADLVNGVTLQGFSPVHIEKVKVIHASESADTVVPITLKATNISDGILPSTVVVGLLPVRISPEDGMAGVLGDKVKSNKGEGGEKHFVTPKKSTEMADEFVKLRAKGLEDAWLTPGDPNQLVEWDPSVGELNGDIRKWKVKRDATGKFPVKIRTIAKYGNGEATKRNVWVTWADITTDAPTPEILPATSNATELKLKGKIRYRYNCLPTEMFDLTADVADLSTPISVAPPSINPRTGVALSGGAGIRYDASRQVRVVSRSNVQAVQSSLLAGGLDIPDYPTNIIEGNDDPDQSGELRPYIPQGTTAIMTDFDNPHIDPPDSIGSGTPQATIVQTAQFREFARAQIGSKWYKCSDYFLCQVILKAKRENDKWIDDGSTFSLGNSPFPPP